jgi:hypothetical protein
MQGFQYWMIIFVQHQYFIFKHRKAQGEGENLLKEKESITDSFLFLLRYKPQAFTTKTKD